MRTGKFITFEGGEGSGKSTQARLLADRLREMGIEPVLTREPGGTPAAEQVRSLLLDPTAAPRSVLSEALLFYAARADHMEKLVKPALADGRWVICDRFSDSTRVYQVEAGQLPIEDFRALERLVVDRTRPDLTFILDVPVHVGLSRANARRQARGEAADAYEVRDLEFHERLCQGYREVAKKDRHRCKVIDATMPVDMVAGFIWGHVVSELERADALASEGALQA